MFKTILRFLVVTLIAVALGFGIYYLVQPAGATSQFGNLRDFGERGFREGGFNLIGGLFGITGNLMLVALITVIVVSIQKIFSQKPEPAATR